jgi:hypothetical protein
MAKKKSRKVYEVCMRAGSAEACALVEAASKANAKSHALARARRNEVSWEGRRRGPVRVVSVTEE